MTLDEALTDDERKKLAQAIAMLTDMVARLSDAVVSNSSWDSATLAPFRKQVEMSLDAAGWALARLGECKAGDNLEDACRRLIRQHNEGVTGGDADH